jgi:predicted N-acetyltransferase YhbS
MAITIRPLLQHDLDATRRIIRLAFGSFLGVPDPENFRIDIDAATTRWKADPGSAFVAEMDGEVVGSNFATRWGSVGFFGPLTVRPGLWDRGIGQQLMQPILNCFEQWKLTHAGLYTFAHSPKHIGLYQRYGFWPRFLTAIMSKPVETARTAAHWPKFSEGSDHDRDAWVNACRALTHGIYPGLDLEREVRAVQAQGLGDTVLISDADGLAGFAVCQCGPGTEGGADECYIKFGAVRSAPSSGALFEQLLNACESLAATRGVSRIEAGVNLSRPEAYRKLLERGFRTDTQGVAMHRPNEPGYSRPGVYVIDDWR